MQNHERSEAVTPRIRFRFAAREDIPLLRDLAQRIWRACYRDIITAEQIEFMLEWMYSPARISEELDLGFAWKLIEDDRDQALGFLAFHLERDRRMKLDKLYVVPKEQGRGIGRAALQHVLGEAAALGATAVWLQVNKHNTRAVASYRKAGFRVAQEAVFEIGGGFVMDDYLMEKLI